MNDIDKLRIMLPHWIEHNTAHAGEFVQWAEKVQNSGHVHRDDIAAALARAVSACEEVTAALEDALESAGGALDHDHDHSH